MFAATITINLFIGFFWHPLGIYTHVGIRHITLHWICHMLLILYLFCTVKFIMQNCNQILFQNNVDVKSCFHRPIKIGIINSYSTFSYCVFINNYVLGWSLPIVIQSYDLSILSYHKQFMSI